MKPHDFHAQTEKACQDPELARKLHHATERQFQGRLEICKELGEVDRFRDLAAGLRDDLLRRLSHHLAEFAEKAESHGVAVHWAGDEEEARRTVREIAARHQVQKIVKSKSMLTEEIGLNDYLTEEGLKVLETDLGEFIIQLAGQRPSHIVTPAIHMSAQEVVALFEKHLDYRGPPDPKALTLAAREYMRDQFMTADMGISGVNFAVAREGMWTVCTNEGNGRYVTGMPRVYVALMGVERIVQDLKSAAVILKLLARFATGQRITQYVNFTRGPGSGPLSCVEPEHVHLVILDNGRSRILGTKYWSMLRCIRCGACLNVCPVFRHIGGQAFPGCYSGPMGSVLLPLQKGLKEAGTTARACSLCRACAEVCPVKIPLPDLLLELRADMASAGHCSLEERWGMAAGAQVLQHPVLYRLAKKFLHITGSCLSRDEWIQHLPGWPGKWTVGRDFPLPEGKSFLAGLPGKRKDKDG